MLKSFTVPTACRSTLSTGRSLGLHLLHAARPVILAAAATLALAVLPSALYGSPPASRRVVIVESKGATGTVDRPRLIHVVGQVCSELHIEESAVPQIVVIHLTNDEAHAGGLPPGSTLMVERSFVNVDGKADATPARFLVWMVGRPDDQMMVAAVAHVLRLHLQLDLSDQDLLQAEGRILNRLGATVDANAFVKPRQ